MSRERGGRELRNARFVGRGRDISSAISSTSTSLGGNPTSLSSLRVVEKKAELGRGKEFRQYPLIQKTKMKGQESPPPPPLPPLLPNLLRSAHRTQTNSKNASKREEREAEHTL